VSPLLDDIELTSIGLDGTFIGESFGGGSGKLSLLTVTLDTELRTSIGLEWTSMSGTLESTVMMLPSSSSFTAASLCTKGGRACIVGSGMYLITDIAGAGTEMFPELLMYLVTGLPSAIVGPEDVSN
jgi:hypothetical protein